MLEFHHIGILVDNIDSSLQTYQGLFGVEEVDGPYDISSQGVRVCFLKMDRGHLEFVQQLTESSILDALKKRKVKYYHVGYCVRNIDDAVKELCERNFKHLSTFASEAFSLRKCAFLFSPELHLVELIEKA